MKYLFTNGRHSFHSTAPQLSIVHQERIQGIPTMSSMEVSGFLSDGISQWIEKHRENNRDWFRLCEDINEFAHSTMFTIKIQDRSLPKIIVASLYVRAMSNFQATILMSERGMIRKRGQVYI